MTDRYSPSGMQPSRLKPVLRICVISAAYTRPALAFDLLAFDFDLKRPVKPRWPNADFEPWATRQDAGLAAPGHGWPVAAAHGSGSVFGHAEPKRGTKWWGKSVLLTFDWAGFRIYQK